MAAYGRKITKLAEKIADFGVGMAFHHHMGTFVETDAEVDRLMATTGKAVGLLFDTGHCIYAHGDPQALLERHIGRVVHVHCKDIRRPVLERAWAERHGASWMPCWRGSSPCRATAVDYPPLLRRLARGRLCRLAGRRGRAGPGQGASADLRHARMQKPCPAG